MLNQELELHTKLNLLLNGLGSIQNGKIDISNFNATTKASSVSNNVVCLINTSTYFPDFISFGAINNN